MVNGNNLSVACYDAGHLVGEDRVAVVAAPMLHVVREGYAYALRLQTVGRVDATGVVEHDKSRIPDTWCHAIYRALILGEFLPPLRVFVLYAEQGLVACLPLVGRTDISACPRQTDVKRLAHSLIAPVPWPPM